MVSTPKKINLLIATGEPSGDDLAIYLIKQIRSYLSQKDPVLLKNIEINAVGGNKLKKKGIRLVFNRHNLAVMGIFETIFYLPKLLKLRNLIYQFCLNSKVDLFIGVDSPDFYLALEKKLKRQKIKTIHFVCPSVYAWRSYRLKKITHCVDLLLGILPFEREFIQQYCQKNQLKLNYQAITHPIFNQDLQKEMISSQSIKEHLKLNDQSKIIALFLGSRKNEIKKHLPVMIQLIQKIKQKYPNYVFVSSTFNQSHHKLIQKAIDQHQLKNCFSLIGKLDDLIHQCEFSIAKSGTINLYLAKASKPMIIFYKLNWLSYLITKALAYQNYVSLVNWTLGKKVFPELIQNQFNCKNLVIEFEKIIKNPNQFKQHFEKINHSFQNYSQQDSKINSQEVALEKIYQLLVSKSK